LYRYSTATQWTDADKSKAEARGWRSEAAPEIAEVDAISALADISFQAQMDRSGCVNDNELAKQQHVGDCLKTLKQIDYDDKDGLAPCHLLHPTWMNVQKISPGEGTLVEDVIDRITTVPPVLPSEPVNQLDEELNNPSDRQTDPQQQTPETTMDTLNTKQQRVFDGVIGWYQALLRSRTDNTFRPPAPLFVLVHGPPGTGKTKVANDIAHAVPCATCAPTGISASLFLSAITLHGMFMLPIDETAPMQPLAVEKLSVLKALLAGKEVILMDEVSFISPVTLNRINQRLQQIRNNDQPFGGMAMVVSAP
jgi:hypothetical protein